MATDVGHNREAEDSQGKSTVTQYQDNPTSPFRTWIKVHWEKLKHVGLHEWLMLLATCAMSIAGPLAFSPDGTAELPMFFDIKNVGQSVATNSSLYAELIFEDRDPFKVREKICSESSALGNAIFPGQSAVRERWPFQILAKDIQLQSKKISTGNVMVMSVVACVDYSGTISGTRYHTGYLYQVVAKNAGPMIPVGQTIPKENLGLFPMFPTSITAK